MRVHIADLTCLALKHCSCCRILNTFPCINKALLCNFCLTMRGMHTASSKCFGRLILHVCRSLLQYLPTLSRYSSTGKNTKKSRKTGNYHSECRHFHKLAFYSTNCNPSVVNNSRIIFIFWQVEISFMNKNQ